MDFPNTPLSPMSVPKEEKEDIVKSPTMNVNQNGVTQKEQKGFLMLTEAVIANPNDHTLQTKVAILLDGGSEATFVNEKLVQQLKLPQKALFDVAIKPFMAEKQNVTSSFQTIHIQTTDGCWNELLATTLPKMTGKLDMLKATKKDGQYFLDEKPTKVTPMITIGSDQLYKFLQLPQHELGVTIIESQFGPIVTGVPKATVHTDDKSNIVVVNSTGTEKDKITADLQRLWSLQNIGITDSPNSDEDDDTALLLFQKYLRFDPKTKRYVVALPWKDANPDLSDTKKLAMGRFLSLIRRLNTMPPDVFKQYHETIMAQLEAGIIELVDEHSVQLVYYIPHHVVVNQNKLNPKPRIVLDASAETRTGKSLNKNLYRGPVLLPQLLHILIRIRLFLYLMVGDITKAFHQIMIRPEDRDCTRFFWLKDINKPPTPDNILIYRFTRVVFGIICSPFMLSAVVAHHLRKYGTALAIEILQNIYVDNIFVEFSTTEEAFKKHKEMIEMFSTANMPLREFATNCPTVLKFLRQFEDIPDTIKLLGLYWNLTTDTIGIKIIDVSATDKSTLTMRIVLKQLAKIYDVLGFVCPVILKMKILLQKLHIKNYKWDDQLQETDQKEWFEATNGWNGTIISLPRFCPSGDNQEIHVFVDASSLSFAAVAYLRVRNKDNSIQVTILLAKMQIKPKNATTIPRMELLAVLLGTKVLEILRKANFEGVSAFIWSDSTAVLGWIRTQKCQGRFVENRLNAIRATKNVTFRHVPTAVNVADKATRGLTPNELQNDNEWWNGPKFLKFEEKDWPQLPLTAFLDQQTPFDDDHQDDAIACNLAIKTLKPVIDIKRFSSYAKVLRTMMFVLRTLAITFKSMKFIENISRTGTFTKTDSTIAERILIRFEQQQNPPTKDQIRNLDLQQDKHRIWRCYGRLNKAEVQSVKPVWLPETSWLTKLIILHVHQKTLHSSTLQTLAILRNRFWICRGRQIVQSAIKKLCNGCRRYLPPYALRQMPQLPAARVTRSIPFSHSAVDYAGPVTVHFNNEKIKCWISVFTCLATRSCHLELITNLTTTSFIKCFRRFIARRGVPCTIYSDNSTTFTLASKSFDAAWNDLLQNVSCSKYFTTSRIQWTFTTPLSPWEGGVFERMVGIMKKSLKFAFKKTITFEDFSTSLCEVEAIVNARPITFVSNEAGSADVLRSADFLHPNCLLSLPITCEFETDDDIDFTVPNPTTGEKVIQLWKKSLLAVETFWKFWSDHYLNSLRERQRLQHKGQKGQVTSEPNIGDIVIVQQEEIPRSQWPLARIVEITKRHDDAIKAVKLEFHDKSTKLRPLNAIVPLEAAPIQKVTATDPTSDTPVTANQVNTYHASTNVVQKPLFYVFMMLLFTSCNALECNKNENLELVSQQSCVRKGIAIMKNLQGYYCEMPVICPDGHLNPHSTSYSTICGPKCHCPPWASSCSHYEGSSTQFSIPYNDQTLKILKTIEVEICAMDKNTWNTECSNHTTTQLVHKIQLFDNSTHIVDQLKLASTQPHNDAFLCLGKGTRSGSKEFCEHHRCTEPATMFCFYPANEKVTLITETGNILLKAWNTQLLTFYPPKTVHHLSTTCDNCSVTCSTGGITVTVTSKIGKIETCTTTHCYSQLNPETTTTVLFPPDIVLHKYKAVVTLWSHAILVRTFDISCSPQPFCEHITCIFCIARITNYHCNSILWYLVIFIFLYMISMTVYTWFKICKESASAISTFCSTAKSTILFFIPRRWQREPDPTSVEVPHIIVVNPQINNVEHPQLRQRSLSALRKGLLYSSTIFFALITSTYACGASTSLTAKQEQCFDHGDNITCQVQQTTLLTLTPTGQETCLLLKAPDDSPLGTLVIHVQKVSFQCSPKTNFYTRDARFKVISSKRCPNAGTCDDYPGCGNYHDHNVAELRGQTEELPHHNFCSRSCACAGCGCFYCTNGCLFYRLYATPLSRAIYRVYECPSWHLVVTITVSLQHHEAEQFSTTFQLTPGVPVTYNNLTLTLGSTSTPELPILGKSFITDGTNTAVIHGAVSSETMESYISKFTCPGWTSATDFKCQFNPSVCACKETQNSVHCNCPSHDIQSLIKNDQHTLPLATENYHMKVVDHQLQTTLHQHTAVQLQVDFQDVTMQLKQDYTTCDIKFIQLDGCHSCLTSSKIRLQCQTNFGQAVAHVQCNQTTFSVVCTEAGDEQDVFVSFDQKHVLEFCVGRCPAGTTNFSIEGVLATLQSITTNRMTADGSLDAAENINADIPLFDFLKANWLPFSITFIVAVAAVILTIMILPLAVKIICPPIAIVFSALSSTLTKLKLKVAQFFSAIKSKLTHFKDKFFRLFKLKRN